MIDDILEYFEKEFEIKIEELEEKIATSGSWGAWDD
jgi:hypothetical protein